MYQYSRRFSFVSEDMKKVAKGACIAMLGALATYLLDTIPSVDFGSYTVLVGALNSVVANAILKFVSEHSYNG